MTSRSNDHARTQGRRTGRPWTLAASLAAVALLLAAPHSVALVTGGSLASSNLSVNDLGPGTVPTNHDDGLLEETVLPLLQQTIHDVISTIDLADTPEDSDPNVTTFPGNDFDQDGRVDFYYARIYNQTADQVVCTIHQSDFVNDLPRANSGAPHLQPHPEEPGNDVTLTFMVYDPTPHTGDACPIGQAPARTPFLNVTGHVDVYVPELTDPLGSSESDPTRISVYDPQTDQEQLRIEAFFRPIAGASHNAGQHIVLRNFNPDEIDDPVFPTPMDLTNLHVYSGGSFPPPTPASVVGVVQQHDWDDDGFRDIEELISNPFSTNPDEVVFHRSNPLDDDSIPTDYDGDGVPNSVDPEPIVPDPLGGWVIEITSPVLNDDLAGDVYINWTATQVSPTAPTLKNFTIEAVRFNPSNNQESVRVTIAENLTSTDRQFIWDTHATRFSLGTIDSGSQKYRIELTTNTTTDQESTVESDDFDLTNFAYDIDVVVPEAGETYNGTIPVEWTAEPARSGQLPIDHFKLRVLLDGAPDEWWIVGGVDELPPEARTFEWDTIMQRINGPHSDNGEVLVDDDDYQFEVRAYDDAEDAEFGPQEQFHLTDEFELSNAPAPTVSNVELVDANGAADAPGFLSGDVLVNFTVTPGRPADDPRLSHAYTIEFRSCPTSASVGGTLLTTLTGDLTDHGDQSIPVPRSYFVNELDTGGAPHTCRANNIGGADFEALNNNLEGLGVPLVPENLDNDGGIRVEVDVTETQTFEAPYNGDFTSPPGTGRGGEIYRIFNNELPALDGLTAERADVADLTATGLAAGENVRLRANFTDPGWSCIVDSLVPQLVKGRVYNATGAFVAEVDLARATADAVNPEHVNPCLLMSTPPHNSDLGRGIVYEGLVPLDEGDYVFNVSAIDAHGNSVDGPHPAVLSANHAFSVGGPLGVETIEKFVNETLDQVNNTFNSVVNLLENALGCDLFLDGADGDHPSPLACVEENATRAYETTIGLIEDTLACDLDGDGTPALAPECEDVAGRLTEALNDNLSMPADEAGAGLPNVWQQVWGCDPFLCPNDWDLDGYDDAEELAAGTNITNPYSNPLDADADLILDLIESGEVGVDLPGPFNLGPLADLGGVDVNLYRIDWVNGNNNPATPCTTDDDYDDCVGQLQFLDTPEKHVAVYAPTGETILRVEEAPPDLVRASTTLAGGHSWSAVDGLLWTDFDGSRVMAQANYSDGNRFVRVEVNLGALGPLGGQLVNIDLFNADMPEPIEDNLTHSVGVSVNPLAVTVDDVHVWDVVLNLAEEVKIGDDAPQRCDNPGPQEPVGEGTWVRGNREADSWIFCFQVEGDATGPLEVPFTELPVAGVFIDEAGFPVPWLDENGNGQYDEGEQLLCPPNAATLDCASQIIPGLACEGLEWLTCVDELAKDVIGECEDEETATECVTRLVSDDAGDVLEELGCDEGEAADDCADRLAKDAIGECEEGETAADCIIRRVTEAPLDLDGDGYDNVEEIQADSNPLYARSTPGDNGDGFLVDWDADGWSNNVEPHHGSPSFYRSDATQRCSTPPKPQGPDSPDPPHDWVPTDPPCE